MAERESKVESDAAAFAELYGAAAEDVTRLCRRLLDSADEAEDARHEVFLRAQKAFASYDRARPFRRWLLAVAANHCIDRLRRRRTEARWFDASDVDADALPAAGPNPLTAALARERHGELRAALDALPARYRAALTLRYFAELEYAEMAELLGLTVTQVGVVLFRAKARLREAVAGKGERP